MHEELIGETRTSIHQQELSPVPGTSVTFETTTSGLRAWFGLCTKYCWLTVYLAISYLNPTVRAWNACRIYPVGQVLAGLDDRMPSRLVRLSLEAHISSISSFGTGKKHALRKRQPRIVFDYSSLLKAAAEFRTYCHRLA